MEGWQRAAGITGIVPSAGEKYRPGRQMKTQPITMDVIGSASRVIKGSFLVNVVEHPAPSGLSIAQDGRE